MKKWLPGAVLMFVVILGVAWSISWFTQARHIRQAITEGMTALDPALGSFKAASVETSGFPAKMVVAITNPEFTLHMKPALAALHKYSMATAGNSAGVLTTPEYRESTLHYLFEGQLILTLNAMSDDLQLEYTGNDTLQLRQGAASTSLSTERDGAFHCRMKLDHSLASLTHEVWDLQQYLENAAIKGMIREAGCDFPGSITTDTASNQIVSTMAPGHLWLTNALAQKSYNATFSLLLKDYEIMPAGDAAMNEVRRAITPTDKDFMPIVMSLYGKQSLMVDLSATTPENFQPFGEQPFRIDLTRFRFSSDASHSDATLHVSSTPEGSMQHGKVAWHFTSEFAPRQTDIARANMGQFMRGVLDNKALAANLRNADTTKIEAALFDVLPEVTALGTISQNVEARFTLDKTKKNSAIEVSALEIGTRDYGISGGGKANIAEGQPFPALQANLTCKNCLAMIEMMGAYLRRVDKAAVVLSPDNAGQFVPSEKEVQGVLQLVQAVAKPASGADLEFAVTSNAGTVDINGKTLPELLQLTQQYLGNR